MDVMSDKKVSKLIATQGKTRIYELDDGIWLTARDGTVAWRNNNPGNLKFGYAGSADDPHHQLDRSKERALGMAQAEYEGVVDLDQWGNAVFESYEAGRNAQKHLLQKKMKDKTAEELVLSYSAKDYSGNPHHDSQVAIIHKTATSLGLDLHDKTVGQMTSIEVDALADGLAKAEYWKAGTVEKSPPLSEDQLRAALGSQPPVTPETPGDTSGRHHTLVYRQGNHGAAIVQLQQDLAALGMTSTNGLAVQTDGHFGQRTRQAVEAFQLAHGLKPDGVVGPATLTAMTEAKTAGQAQTPSLLDAKHPAHDLYLQAYQCLARIDESHGRTPDACTQRFAGSLASAAAGVGLQQIDHVLLSTDASRGVAVQGALDSPLKQYASVSVMEAIQTPLAQSSLQAARHMETVGAPDPLPLNVSTTERTVAPAL